MFVILALSAQLCAAEDDPKASYGAEDLVQLDGKAITVDANICRLIGEKTQIVASRHAAVNSTGRGRQLRLKKQFIPTPSIAPISV